MMVNLRLLSIERKKNKRKDSSRTWVKSKNPLTGDVDGPHYDLGCFPDEIYKCFFRENNRIVKLAKRYDVELGEKYDFFMKIGMRFSQQLDGPIREKTEESYYKELQELQELFLQKCRIKFEQDEKAAYQKIFENLEGNISEKELGKIKNIIPKLRSIEIPTEISPSRRERTLEDRILNMSCETNTDFLEYIPSLPEEIRFPFFNLMTYHRQTGEEREFPYFAEEISSTLNLIGIENGKIYLEMLRSISNNKELYDEIRLIKYKAEEKTSKKMDLFFQTLKKTGDLDKGYEVLLD